MQNKLVLLPLALLWVGVFPTLMPTTPQTGERGPALPPSLLAVAPLSNPPPEKQETPAVNSPAAPITLPHFEPRTPAWRTLLILAVPRDLWSDDLQGPDPGKVGAWFGEHGREWFQDSLAPELREFFLRVTYGQVPLDIEVTPWLRLPQDRTAAAPLPYTEERMLEARDALREARKLYPLEDYRALIVLDPTSPTDPRFAAEWREAWGKFYPRADAGTSAIIAGVFHGGTRSEPDPVAATARILAHEIAHAVDFARDGHYDLLDNTGSNFCLHGLPEGGEPWLCPFNEAALLNIGPRTVGPGDHLLKPVEEGPGNGLRVPAGASEIFLEYRLAANPLVAGQEGPALLAWRVNGGRAELVEALREPGRSLRTGTPVELLTLGAGGAEVRVG